MLAELVSLPGQPTLWQPIVLSAKIASLSLILHLFFGTLLGYLLSRETLPFRGVLDVFVTLPLVFPPIATGFFLLLLFGRDGWLGSWLGALGVEMIFSFWGVLLASFIAGLPLIVKPVQSAIESSAQNLKEAAYTLGKGELETMLFVVFPLIKKSIAAGLILAFGRSLGEVGITLMLGGNIAGRTDTISLAIYNAVFDGDFDTAIFMSVLLGLVSVGVFFTLRRLTYL
jgi:molybdate transport system permease protein